MAKHKKEKTTTFHLSGRITDRSTRNGLSGLRVEAVDKDPGYDQPVGSATTDEQGNYAITFSSTQTGKGERGGPEIVISVFDQNGRELGSSAMYANAPANLTIDLEVELPVEPKPTAYQTLLNSVSPLLGARLLRKLDDVEIGTLAEKAGVDAKSLAGLVAAARMAYRANLPQELFFALVRNTEVSDLDTLFSRSPEQLLESLSGAVKENLVDSSVMARLADLEALRPGHESLAHLTIRLGIDLSPAVMKVLNKKNIRSLADISKLGGLEKLKGLPKELDPISLKLLNSHANLSRISPNAKANASVIDRGFTSLREIAVAQPHEFAGAVGGLLGLDTALLLHGKAAARELMVRNAMTTVLAHRANRYGYPINLPAGGNLPLMSTEKCRCDDCASAVSPLAYLADLMDYCIRHLRSDVSETVQQYAAGTNMQARRIGSGLPLLPNPTTEDPGGEPAPGSGDPTTNGTDTGNGGGTPVAPPTPFIRPQNRDIATYVVDVTFTFLPPSNARIFYTTDGSNPVPGTSPEYDRSPVTLVNPDGADPRQFTVKAVAARESTEEENAWIKGLVASATFTLAPMRVAAPPVVVPGGTTAMFAPATVFITCADASVKLHYTMDGSEPDGQSPVFSWDSPPVFATPGTHIVKAKGYLAGSTASETITSTIVVEAGFLLAQENGLTAEYYQDKDLIDLQVLTRDACLQFDWQDHSPDPRINPETFSARWTGWITPRFSEEYTFHTVTDDGVRLWVNGKQIIDHWNLQAPTEVHSLPISLIEGKRYTIKMEFFENTGRAVAMLFWSSKNQRKEVIPPQALRPSTIDLAFLDDTFFQPFSKLPASCEMMDEKVRQVRIAIEVLRAYLGTSVNDAAEAPYRLAAYRALLIQFGTSFEELRLARSAPEKSRQALADRIAIPLAHLDELLLDPASTDPASQLTEGKLERVFGLWDTHGSPFHPLPSPHFRQWRQEQLRVLWQAQDWGVDSYDEKFEPAAGRQPIIDPDVIGPDDFRFPDQANTAFAIWIKRREWADAQLIAFDQIAANAVGSKIDALVTSMYDNPARYETTSVQVWGQTPASEFVTLFDALTSGTTTEAKAAADAISANLHIAVDAFLKLMAVRSEDHQGAVVSDDDWQEIYSILLSAQKAVLAAAWRRQENQSSAEFGPKDFWIPILEPKPGKWPLAKSSAGFYSDLSKVPFIDPDNLKEFDLPDPTAGKRARELWKARKEQLVDFLRDLKLARQSSFLDMLKLALGDPIPVDLDRLWSALQSSDATVSGPAEASINGVLHLTTESFARLIAVRAKDALTDPQKKPTSAEYADVETLLVQAHKFMTDYPVWANEEAAEQLVYWQCLRAQLPRWSARNEDRQLWQQALLARSAPAIIDPDLNSPADIKSPVTGDGAYDLWRARYDWVNERLTDIKAAREGAADPAVGLDALVSQSIGIDPVECWGLVVLRDAGQSIGPRLTQWNLSNGAYDRLTRIHDLANSGPELILADEWDEVYSILLQVEKVRESASWREQEAAQKLTLSQDYFVAPNSASNMPFDAGGEWQPVPWRSTWRDRHDWQDKLNTRIDQEAAVDQAITAAIGAVEKATLPMLRDTLISNSAADGNTLVAKANTLSKRLLIDMKAGGCQMTSRIAQAIETLQSLIWLVRIGQWHDPVLQLALVAPNFDEESKWIGSYAMWRAAMFVFIHFETLMLPTLRKSNTPGFAALVSDLRAAPNLTPRKALRLAKTYTDYFSDVCNLDVEASIVAPRRANVGTQDEADEPISFFIGRSKVTNRIYWSERKDTASTSHQSYWFPLDALSDVEEIIGCLWYEAPARNRTLYLFALVSTRGTQKLVFLTYDLSTNKGWDLVATPIEFPDGVSRVSQVRLSAQTNGASVPRIALWINSDETNPEREYAGGFNVQGSGLDHDGFRSAIDTISFGEGRPDIHESELNVPIPKIPGSYNASDIAQFMMQVSYYAQRENFTAGIPTFKYRTDANTNVTFFGAHLFKPNAVELRDVPAGDLNFPRSRVVSDFNAYDVALRFNAARSYAIQNGFSAGFPTFDESEGDAGFTLCLCKPGAVKSVTHLHTIDLPGSPRSSDSGFVASDVANRFAGLADYIVSHTATWAAFPTFIDEGTADDPSFEVVFFNADQTVDKLTGPWQPKRQIPTDGTVPNYEGPFDVTPYGLQEHPGIRSERSKRAFLDNAAGDESNLVYFKEAWYFVPMLLGGRLNDAGCYLEALDWYRTVYDYGAAPAKRLNYYGLVLDQNKSTTLARAQDWLDDPLNPHLLAETRQYADTLYTEYSIYRCMLNCADADYTLDTPESVPRARQFYEFVLDGLEAQELKQTEPCCEDPVNALDAEIRNTLVGIDRTLLPFWARLRDMLLQWDDCSSLTKTIKEIRSALFPTGGTTPWLDRFVQAWTIVETARHESDAVPMIADALSTNVPDSWTALANTVDAGIVITGVIDTSAHYVPALNWLFCIPENPVRKAMQLHAAINLYKMQHCRNIAGMERVLDTYAAATDATTGMPVIGAAGQIVLPGTAVLRPTPYKYATLIERAKQITQLAAQAEASMLLAVEKSVTEAYSLSKARQDLQLANGNIRLQDLKIKEAADGTTLATMQRDRAQIQLDHYQGLLSEDLILSEVVEMASLLTAGTVASISFNIAAVSKIKVLEATEDLAKTYAQVAQQIATFERRRQDWKFDQQIAQQDTTIGNQQIANSKDREQIAGQEKVIAELTRDHDEAAVDFLTNKFTNVELYDWMSNVLGRVYAFFLQQATATAKLAEGQLTFERHEPAPGYIQDDYWDAPSDQPTVSGGAAPDRRGLTGSARLLQDIYQLDLYAEDRNKRKLNLNETISLARLAPGEFQRFRETGVISFRTPMELFDRKFPGHYLRLIKRVRTSALWKALHKADYAKSSIMESSWRARGRVVVRERIGGA